MNQFRIYVDTNVLTNYFTRQADDVRCLDYLFSKVRKEILFTSSLAVVQTLSILQTRKKYRKAFVRKNVIESGRQISKKFSIIDLSCKDVEKSFELQNKDVEDNVHYVLSKKLNCNIIVTNNTCDFAYFWDIVALSPKNIASIRKMIK